MLTVHQISKGYGVHTVLDKITFSLDNGDRVGLIGPNGSGKTTLIRILIGLEQPDSGSVTRTPPGLKIGYLTQGLELDPQMTISQAYAQDGPVDPEAVLEELASALGANPSDPNLQDRYDELITRLPTYRRTVDLAIPLGLVEIDGNRPIGSLSGDQKTRLMLVRLLSDEPNLLLLDEPTNHLDIAMLEWVERWLNGFRGAALIVSHDRTFLDNSVNRILDLNPETHTVREYDGN